TGLGRFLSRIAKREAAPALAVPQATWVGRELVTPAPIDDDALLLAWPLPEDPKLRAKIRAVAQIAYALVDGRVRGRVMLGELGDARAPVLALFVLPSLDETFAQAKRGAQRAVAGTSLVFLDSGFAKLDRFVFER